MDRMHVDVDASRDNRNGRFQSFWVYASSLLLVAGTAGKLGAPLFREVSITRRVAALKKLHSSALRDWAWGGARSSSNTWNYELGSLGLAYIVVHSVLSGETPRFFRQLISEFATVGGDNDNGLWHQTGLSTSREPWWLNSEQADCIHQDLMRNEKVMACWFYVVDKLGLCSDAGTSIPTLPALSTGRAALHNRLKGASEAFISSVVRTTTILLSLLPTPISELWWESPGGYLGERQSKMCSYLIFIH